MDLQVVFFPTTAEKSCQVFTVVCDNCQVKDISIEGKSQQEALLRAMLRNKLCIVCNVRLLLRWGPADRTGAGVCVWGGGASCGWRGAWPYCRALYPFQPMQPSLCATEEACHQKQCVRVARLMCFISKSLPFQIFGHRIGFKHPY